MQVGALHPQSARRAGDVPVGLFQRADDAGFHSESKLGMWMELMKAVRSRTIRRGVGMLNRIRGEMRPVPGQIHPQPRLLIARRFWLVSVTLASLAAPPSRSQVPSTKSELDLGVTSYQKGVYLDAIEHLERAVSADPSATVAHFYLASAYDGMCSTPNGCDTHWSDGALREYNKVLELDPHHKEALKSKAYLLYRLARFDKSEAAYRTAVKLDANDPEAMYSIAVLIFHRIHPVLMGDKMQLHLAPHQPIYGQAECNRVHDKYAAEVEEAIDLLTKVVHLLRNVDAETYLATFYFVRGQIQCDRSLYKRDLLLEQQWWNRACVTWHDPERSSLPRWIAGQGPPPPKRGDTCKWW